jgi:hypothetical protein
LAAPVCRSSLVREDENRIARIQSAVMDNLTLCSSIPSDSDSDGEIEIILADDSTDLFGSDDETDGGDKEKAAPTTKKAQQHHLRASDQLTAAYFMQRASIGYERERERVCYICLLLSC